jgi:hypothetical protein
MLTRAGWVLFGGCLKPRERELLLTCQKSPRYRHTSHRLARSRCHCSDTPARGRSLGVQRNLQQDNTE